MTVRNDGSVPLSRIFLQLTSTARWNSITREGAAQTFTEHKIQSDADHTGEMSEARVVLARPIGAGASAELDLSYSISVFHESRRLRNVGAPVEDALKTDWDRISTEFTGVRGAGYVAWYPMALEPKSMSDGNAVFREIERWKAREAQSEFEIVTRDAGKESRKSYSPLGMNVPVLTGVSAPTITRNGVGVFADSQVKAEAVQFANGTEEFAEAWLPQRFATAKLWVLPEDGDAPFVSAGEAFVGPSASQQAANAVTLHAVTSVALASPRQWIQEGYAGFLELAFLQQERGRPAALDRMRGMTRALALDEPDDADSADTSLINSGEEIRYRLKGALVWWMLRDLVGDAVLQRAIKRYKIADDREPEYLQRLIESESHKDLAWFFADWVYRDRGLPELSVASAAARKTLDGKWTAEIKIANSGRAGAYVPVTVIAGDEERSVRVLVRGHDSTLVTINTAAKPQHVRVNDGSVPETDPNDNEADIR